MIQIRDSENAGICAKENFGKGKRRIHDYAIRYFRITSGRSIRRVNFLACRLTLVGRWNVLSTKKIRVEGWLT